ncbi:MAG TPA: hypothetical protein VEL31_27335, partial [Ktedonobacteraceae bacterium]|nr:hypothetical protein [Ktedonobacteraceae bacterium]
LVERGYLEIHMLVLLFCWYSPLLHVPQGGREGERDVRLILDDGLVGGRTPASFHADGGVRHGALSSALQMSSRAVLAC